MTTMKEQVTITAIGTSGGSGISTLCKNMPQCSMCMFSRDTNRCFFVIPNDQTPPSPTQHQVLVKEATDAICNILVFVVSAKEREFDYSMKAIEKWMQISHSFGTQKVIVAVNKMDAVQYSEDRFNAIKARMNAMMREQQRNFPIDELLAFIPLSALKGDNMSVASSKMAWYDGPTLNGMVDDLTRDANLLGFTAYHTIGETAKICLDKTVGFETGQTVNFFPFGIRKTKVESLRSYENIIDVPHGGKVIRIDTKIDCDVSKSNMSIARMMATIGGMAVSLVFCLAIR